MMTVNVVPVCVVVDSIVAVVVEVRMLELRMVKAWYEMEAELDCVVAWVLM